jgi:hypothetical protein
MLKYLLFIIGLFYSIQLIGQTGNRTTPPHSSVKFKRAFEKKGLLNPSITLSVFIDDLEIMKNDIELSMHLPDAETLALAKGDGWRVPTINELNILYKNRVKIGGFSLDRNIDETTYMSTTEENNDGGIYRLIKVIDFSDGRISWGYYARGPGMKVRFVRTIK